MSEAVDSLSVQDTSHNNDKTDKLPGTKKKKSTKKVSKINNNNNTTNNNNNNNNEFKEVDANRPTSNGYRSVSGKQDEIKEEEDTVPDLPVYEDQTPYGGLRKLSRGKSSTESTDSSGEESTCEDETINGVIENGCKQNCQRRNNSVEGEGLEINGDSQELKNAVEIIVSESSNDTSTRRRSLQRRRGVVEEPAMDTLGDFDGPPMQMPERSRSRRSSTIDLSRSAQRMLLRLSSTGSASFSHEVSPEPAYCNPEMEIFRQRRLSQHGQPRSRRLSLKDLIPDWPSLDYIEKPEYRMPEFKENESGEAQNLELRKMDPSALYKLDNWIEELMDQTCMEKEPKVILSCKFSNPKAKLRWYKNKLEIFHGHKYNFENDNGTFRLIIFRVNVEDTGQYTCATEEKQTSAFLTVEERKQSYQFTRGLPETATVKQKGELVLECILSDSKPSVNWRINDDIIEYTPGLYEIFRRENKCILKIRNVQKDMHEAEISCEVYGDSTVCKLTVDEPDYLFVRQLADVDSFEKETATFECEVNDEEAQVKWLKDDQPIKLNSKFMCKEDGTVRQLLICNVSAQDEGIFSCNVQNKFTFAKLFVEPDVVIRERLKDVQKVENENVKLICKVKNPKGYPVTWLKNNKTITADNRFETSSREGKSHCLTIKSLQLSDAGVYTCKIGDRDTSATLTVTESQTPPNVNVDTVPRELIVRCGKSINIEIPYSGAPRPVMTWTKNGQVLNNGGSIELSQTPVMCYLRVNNARRVDSADYELKLTNDNGTEVVPITVKVIGKPQEPEGPLQVVDVYKDRCRLMWEAPLDDGGVDIEYYLVEMQDTSVRKWTEIGRVQGDTQCGIPSLAPGKMYKFRVWANNAEGDSEPLATEKEILARDPWDPPGKPGQPEIADYDKDRAEIRWSPSEIDGGNPIQKYVIEKRIVPGSGWETVGMVLPKELYAIIPGLEEGKVYEFRVLAVNEAGRGPPSDTSKSVCIKPTRVPPVVDQSSYSHDIKLKCGRDFTVEVHFSGKPTPSATWTRLDDTDLKSCINFRTVYTETSAQLICTSANRSDTAMYRLTISNGYGLDVADVNVVVIGVPDCPTGPLEVTDVRSTNVILHWRPPADDGGRPCLNYIVEKLNVTSGQWERASSSVPSNVTSCKVTRLEAGQRYMFRVCAENDQGCGPALTTELETLAKNPFVAPTAPSPPTIVDSDLDFVKIQWSAPPNDGGAPISGYYVERRDKNTGVWIRLNEEPITGLEYVDRTVKSKKQYEYRVLAENEGGISQPSNESVIAKARLFKDKGHIEGVLINGASGGKSGVDKDGKSVVSVRAGGVIRIDLQISGSPTPVVTWLKDNKPISASNRLSEGSDDDKAFLQISSAARQDSGLYTARVQNEFGFELSTFSINVLDVPSCPLTPRVDEVFCDHCRLSWKPPRDDGGSEVIGYYVELCEDGSNSWIRVTSFASGLTHNVKELRAGRKYKFRVLAENIYGVSEPAVTDVILAKDPFNAPSTPGQPQVSDSDNDFILLKWSRPEDDGGTPVLGYNVERKDPVTGRWIKLNTQLLTTTEYRDRSVQAGKQYQYRITAVGAGGSSNYSETSGQIKARPLKAAPSIAVPPSGHNLQATVGETLTITVPITGSPTPTITWLKNGQPLSVSNRVKMMNGEELACLTIYGVTPEDSGAYTVSVSNAHGQANDIINVKILGSCHRRMTRARSVEPSSDSVAFPGSDELIDHSPRFTFPLRNRLIQQGVGVKLIACVSARPPPKVTWFKESRNITNNDKYSISYVVGVCSLEVASCTAEDAGKYTCTASNTLGQADTSCRVMVHERERRRSFSTSRTFSEEFFVPRTSTYNGF